MTFRLLDLYSGEGGAATGYYGVGFKVYGVDNDANRLAYYPFTSRRDDALSVMANLIYGTGVRFGDELLSISDFDVIHASPPCTGYSRGTAAIPDRFTRYDRLIGVTRELLIETGLPYVIENVADARRELRDPIMLCGRMFGLGAYDTDGEWLTLDRHRLFESNIRIDVPMHYTHDRSVQVGGLYGGARRDKIEARYIRAGGYVPKDLDVQRSLGGTPWATEKGCWLAIPPIYTEWIGVQLMGRLKELAA